MKQNSQGPQGSAYPDSNKLKPPPTNALQGSFKHSQQGSTFQEYPENNQNNANKQPQAGEGQGFGNYFKLPQNNAGSSQDGNLFRTNQPSSKSNENVAGSGSGHQLSQSQDRFHFQELYSQLSNEASRSNSVGQTVAHSADFNQRYNPFAEAKEHDAENVNKNETSLNQDFDKFHPNTEKTYSSLVDSKEDEIDNYIAQKGDSFITPKNNSSSSGGNNNAKFFKAKMMNTKTGNTIGYSQEEPGANQYFDKIDTNNYKYNYSNPIATSRINKVNQTNVQADLLFKNEGNNSEFLNEINKIIENQKKELNDSDELLFSPFNVKDQFPDMDKSIRQPDFSSDNIGNLTKNSSQSNSSQHLSNSAILQLQNERQNLFSPFEQKNTFSSQEQNNRFSYGGGGGGNTFGGNNPGSQTNLSQRNHQSSGNNNGNTNNNSLVAPDTSLISTDVESEVKDHHDNQNNSFSTLFSGGGSGGGTANFSANKMDYYSPARMDSGRLTTETSDSTQSGQKNPNYFASREQQQYNQYMQMKKGFSPLNLSAMNFQSGNHSSGRNSDRSSNVSWNEDAFDKMYNTTRQNLPTNPQNLFNPNMSVDQFLNVQSNFINNGFQNFQNQNLQQQQQQMEMQRRKVSMPTGNDKKVGSNKIRKRNEENFDIDVNNVETDRRSTVMIRNIPNKYDLNLMIQTIDRNYQGKYDFFYLPIDFKNKCNLGYAFINFVDKRYIRDFFFEFNNKRWGRFNSEKICQIRYAKIQGTSALMSHFRDSNIMNQEDDTVKPYIPPEFKFNNKDKLAELIEKQRKTTVSKGGKVQYK